MSSPVCGAALGKSEQRRVPRGKAVRVVYELFYRREVPPALCLNDCVRRRGSNLDVGVATVRAELLEADGCDGVTRRSYGLGEKRVREARNIREGPSETVGQ